MATFTKYTAGLQNVGSYQVSGTPWITGSAMLAASFATNDGEVAVAFPRVTKAITIINNGTDDTPLKVHFNSLAAGNVATGRHYVSLPNYKDSITISVKCTRLYVSFDGDPAPKDSDFEVVAELTAIPINNMYPLTGSGLTE